MTDVILDDFDEIFDALEAAASNAFASDFSKPSLHQIQPRRTGRSEVKMKAGVALEPGLHLWVFVSGVVIHHQMELSFGWCFTVNLAQKLQELFMPMPLKTTAHDRTFPFSSGRGYHSFSQAPNRSGFLPRRIVGK